MRQMAYHALNLETPCGRVALLYSPNGLVPSSSLASRPSFMVGSTATADMPL
jgi:hypothetical protein